MVFFFGKDIRYFRAFGPPNGASVHQATGIAAADVAGGDDKPLLSGHEPSMEAAGVERFGVFCWCFWCNYY